MAIPTDLASLKTSVEDDLARSDLTSKIEDFIMKGEAILNRRLRIELMKTTDATNTSILSGASTMPLPTGYLEHVSVRFTSNNRRLEQVDQDQLDDLKSVNVGKPSHYTIGAASLEFNRTTDQAYNVKHRFFKALDIITDDTNALLTAEPDLYIHAGLVGSIAHTGAHARSGAWVDFLDTGIKDLMRVYGRSRRNRKSRVDVALRSRRRGRYNIHEG
jgi:hypothetical protein